MPTVTTFFIVSQAFDTVSETLCQMLENVSDAWPRKAENGLRHAVPCLFRSIFDCLPCLGKEILDAFPRIIDSIPEAFIRFIQRE